MTGGIHQDITTNIPVIQQLSGSGVIFTSGVIMLLVEMLSKIHNDRSPHVCLHGYTVCVFYTIYTHMVWYAASVNAVGEMLRHCIFTINDNTLLKLAFF